MKATSRRAQGDHLPQNRYAAQLRINAHQNAIRYFNNQQNHLMAVYHELKTHPQHVHDAKYRNALWARYCCWKKALKEQRKRGFDAADAVYLMMTGVRP